MSERGRVTFAVTLAAALCGLLIVARSTLLGFPASVPAPPEHQNCAKSISRAGADIVRARLKECALCERSQVRDKEPETTDCRLADPKNRVLETLGRADALITKDCPDEIVADLALGSCGDTASAVSACIRETHDTGAQELCGAMHGSVALGPTDREEAKCEKALAASATKTIFTVLKQQSKCLNDVLKKGGDTGACGLVLPQIRKQRAKVDGALAKSCSSDVVASLGVCVPPATTIQEAATRLLDEAEHRGAAAVAVEYGLDPAIEILPCSRPAVSTTIVPTTTTSTTSTTLADPVLAPIGDQTALLGSTLRLHLSGTDPQGDPLSFFATPVPLPRNARLDSGTGVFEFTPDAAQVGVTQIRFIVRDGTFDARGVPRSDSELVAITVPAADPDGVTALRGRILDANDAARGVTTPLALM